MSSKPELDARKAAQEVLGAERMAQDGDGEVIKVLDYP